MCCVRFWNAFVTSFILGKSLPLVQWENPGRGYVGVRRDFSFRCVILSKLFKNYPSQFHFPEKEYNSINHVLIEIKCTKLNRYWTIFGSLSLLLSLKYFLNMWYFPSSFPLYGLLSGSGMASGRLASVPQRRLRGRGSVPWEQLSSWCENDWVWVWVLLWPEVWVVLRK